MSLDRSLKVSSGLTRSRSVMTRAERLAILVDEDRWDTSKSVYGLPKVRQGKASTGKKLVFAPKPATDEETPAPEGAKGTA
jgi:small basic protein (TIGR04137 family)